MTLTEHGSKLSERVGQFVREQAEAFGDTRAQPGASNPLWQRLRGLDSELWLDTGDMDAVGKLWTDELTALTTNNTLLNREIQKGTYDRLITEATAVLEEFPLLSEHDRQLELAFILNACHGLRLVARFDAYVSVEEHTDLTDDVEGAVNYARRLHAICPERFYVKIPFSPAGLLATRRVVAEGIPVNHTLGFSARQNVVIARIGRPAFVNVFLGRLNSLVADNDLGDGRFVGERATRASQRAVQRLRDERELSTRQIAASLRDGQQVADLAGVDVLTMPPKVAEEFLGLGVKPDDVADHTDETLEPSFNDGVDPAAVGLDALWEVEDRLVACLDRLDENNLDMFTPSRLITFFARHGCGDVLVQWTDAQRRTSAEEGKIPQLDHWRELLGDRRIGLDSLMNLAGWHSFHHDQREMDEHVRHVRAAS